MATDSGTSPHLWPPLSGACLLLLTFEGSAVEVQGHGKGLISFTHALSGVCFPQHLQPSRIPHQFCSSSRAQLGSLLLCYSEYTWVA